MNFETNLKEDLGVFDIADFKFLGLKKYFSIVFSTGVLLGQASAWELNYSPQGAVYLLHHLKRTIYNF